MTDQELESYLSDLSSAQPAAIRKIRGLVEQHDPGLNEGVITGKWLPGLIGYCTPDGEMI